MQHHRHYRLIDRFIIKADRCLQSLSSTLAPESNRDNPAKDHPDELSPSDKKRSACLMRVNHTGEVCAQALYLGQSLTARNTHVADTLRQAAQEEVDHLQWCDTRLQELDSHKSYLNPLWFAGSLTIGSLAGLVGDKWSLGFLAETEEQVFHHLNDHLKKLPEKDHKSRAILIKMREEEEEHASTAVELGAASLPWPVKLLMRTSAKVMTTLAYYV